MRRSSTSALLAAIAVAVVRLLDGRCCSALAGTASRRWPYAATWRPYPDLLVLRGGGPKAGRKQATPEGASAKAKAGGGATAGAVTAFADQDPDALAGTMPYYPPGSLQDWAQEIAEWRNMTMEEKLAKVEQKISEAGVDPAEQFEQGYTSSSSTQRSDSMTSELSERGSSDIFSSASGEFFEPHDDADNDNSNKTTLPDTLPTANALQHTATAKAGNKHGAAPPRESGRQTSLAPNLTLVEQAEARFAAISSPREDGEKTASEASGPARPEAQSVDSEDSWTLAQCTAPGTLPQPGTFYKEDKALGLQRLRLRSHLVAAASRGRRDGSDEHQARNARRDAEGDDEMGREQVQVDFPGVDLKTGKVTDKGVFESVEQRQQFIDMAEVSNLPRPPHSPTPQTQSPTPQRNATLDTR